MKFDCGETRYERFIRQSEWHEWFAWLPVRVGSHDCRWLEVVERRRVYPWGDWEFRPKEAKPDEIADNPDERY